MSSASSSSPSVVNVAPQQAKIVPSKQEPQGATNVRKASGIKNGGGGAGTPTNTRPIQPQPMTQPPSSNSSGMFDLSMSSMSGMSLGSLGSLGSFSSLGLDTQQQTKMPTDEGPLPTQGSADNGRIVPPSARGAQQQRPTAPQPNQPGVGRSGQPVVNNRAGAATNGQPLAPLQPHPGSAPATATGMPSSGGPGATQTTQPQQQAPSSPDQSATSTAVVPASPGSQSGERRVINPVTVPNGQNFVDITEYLNMPQSEAAKKLSIPPSTLSKRWKEAVRNRKWPWRVVCKLDKEIMTLLHNVPQGAPIPEEIEGRLGYLMRKRQEELKPVVIRL